MKRATLFGISSILFGLRETAAQISNATCGPSYNWMLNSHRQNPCQVVAHLGGVCDAGAQTNIPALKPGELYIGPTQQESNACRCSSVFYSLLSACAICQSREYLNWSIYNRSCSVIYPAVFIGEIPAETTVETWVYQNVTVGQKFHFSRCHTFDECRNTMVSMFQRPSQLPPVVFIRPCK
ncbi:hypothetical protein B0H17DRAFT_234229 [Mycena rosella]|uniref:Secreted protein n=1 Tax=Mycena rosella TaxID=1033263 RepID=A0AAD7MBV1_MYCRO|nr:hypothetical protein B0H17DRAFT_234229 [Mycena rosella]